MKIVPAHVNQNGTKLVAASLALVDGITMKAGHTNATACATMLSMSAAEDLALKAPKLTVEVALNNSEPHLICQA